jgi:hypothetical protein
MGQEDTIVLLIKTASEERQQQTRAFTDALDKLGARMVRTVWLAGACVIVALILQSGIPAVFEGFGFRFATTSAEAAEPAAPAPALEVGE